nr:hypothetical protein [uncultured Pseudodesulfovibrio sp.]
MPLAALAQFIDSVSGLHHGSHGGTRSVYSLHVTGIRVKRTAPRIYGIVVPPQGLTGITVTVANMTNHFEWSQLNEATRLLRKPQVRTNNFIGSVVYPPIGLITVEREIFQATSDGASAQKNPNFIRCQKIYYIDHHG